GRPSRSEWAAGRLLPGGRGGLPPERHDDRALLGAAVDLEPDRVARLAGRDRVAQVLRRADGLAVGRDDDVAAHLVVRAGHGDLRVAAAEPGLGGAGPGEDGADEQPGADGQVERARDRLV